MGSFRQWFVAAAALAVVTSQPDSPSSPDADTEYPTALPTPVPSHLPTLSPTYYPTFTRRPTIVPSVTPSPTITFDPTSQPTHDPTPRPTPYPTTTFAPTATGAPTYPTPPPTHSPTTWEPTTTPTLSPTTELTMFGQQFAIGVSFIMIVIAYAIYSLNKPSELASRGLDYKMFRVREFKIEKRWYCKYCGFTRNTASGPDCRQCGTNQLGEQEILPVHTARGVATDKWSIRTPLVSASSSLALSRKRSSLLLSSSTSKQAGKRLSFVDSASISTKAPASSSSFAITSVDSGNVSFGEGRRLVIWERADWHFTNPHGDNYARLTELPATLALSELGFVVVEKGLSGAAINAAQASDDDDVGGTTVKNRWGVLKKSATPKTVMKRDGLLEWVVAQGGIAESESGSNTSEVAAGMGMASDPLEENNKNKKAAPLTQGMISVGGIYNDAITMRKCFFPEKVAWFYEQVSKLSGYAMSENIPIAYTTAYPSSVLRDSYGLLTKVTPEQVLASSYKVQLIEGQSHSRSTEVEGEVEEKWLQALFSQFVDPGVGVLSRADSGALELTTSPISQSEQKDSGRVSLFAALGRAIAMALVRRVFVGCELTPTLFKLLVGEPICFIDLVHSDQALFQDLLKLMLLPDASVEKLHLAMPNTTTDGGTQCNDDGKSRNGSRDGINWIGRGASVGDPISSTNRLEYVFRKMEYQLFGKTQQEFTALRNAIFEVIPQSLLQVFDYRELAMLLNGYPKAFSEDTFTVSV